MADKPMADETASVNTPAVMRYRDAPAEPGPGWDYPPPARDTVSSDEDRQPDYRWVLVGLVALLAAGGLAAALVFLHPFRHNSASGRPAAAVSQLTSPAQLTSPSSDGSDTQSPAVPPEQQAATALAGLLAQSAADRDAVVNAVSDVGSCGPDLSQDAQTFQNAAVSRQTLLSRLAALPDRSALPAPMLQALTGAWQASVSADQDFEQWAQDEVSQGCTQQDQSDPGLQAATGPDDQATIDKKAFAGWWNPIASQYGLSTYQWSQL
jgi:hypothetical protein